MVVFTNLLKTTFFYCPRTKKIHSVIFGCLERVLDIIVSHNWLWYIINIQTINKSERQYECKDGKKKI